MTGLAWRIRISFVFLSLYFLNSESLAADFVSKTPLNFPRASHTSVLLYNGQVLVVGGNGSTPLATTEAYDPIADIWYGTADLNEARSGHTATVLPNGNVLVVGGRNGGTLLASVEIYDPTTNLWSAGADLIEARFNHTTTLLPSGKVLVTAGSTLLNPLASAEIFDPATNSWSNTSNNINIGRSEHTAILLPNGKVLIVGGKASNSLINVELYDPTSNMWSSVTDLNSARMNHSATALTDGKVLVAAGRSAVNTFLNSAEIYDPDLNTWTVTPTNLSTPRADHTASLLPNGQVLISGGIITDLPSQTYSNSAELFKPTGTTWSNAGTLNTARGGHTAALLTNGSVLLNGGNPDTPMAGAECYTSLPEVWKVGVDMLEPSIGEHSATVLSDGRVLVVGGQNGSNITGNTELYDPVLNTWSTSAPLNHPRMHHTATLLQNGKVLVVGGVDPAFLKSAELYDPVANTWTEVSTDLIEARSDHSATLLPNGKVLVVSGSKQGGLAISSAELFDPGTNTWTPAASINEGRVRHTATLLTNGKVLVAGGGTGTDAGIASCEIYDPGTDSWSSADNLNYARWIHTASLLSNGKVMVTGGKDFGTFIADSELYDPSLNAWSIVPGPSRLRSFHAATNLNNGWVLTTGGVNPFGDSATAEMYDPVNNKWIYTNRLNDNHAFHRTVLLNDGRVLLVGKGDTYSTELYGPNPALRPIISTINSPLTNLGSFILTGSRFKGVSEASSGGTVNSAANFPIVQIESLVDGTIVFLYSDPSIPWTDTTFSSREGQTGLPVGNAQVIVFTNGIPSEPKLIQIENTAPYINPQTFSLAENSITATIVGTVYGSDVDALQTLSYSIVAGNTGDAFAIDASTGEITVNTVSALNFEVTPSFSLTVQVTDDGGTPLSTTGTIAVNLTDVNDSPSISNQTFSIAENSANGTVMGTVVASNEDSGQTLSYAITAGNIGNAFTINISTGEIAVSTASELNFEATPSFSLTVQVTDDWGIPLSTTGTISVNLMDVNESPLINSAITATPNTTTTGATIVFNINAADPEGGNLSVTWNFGDSTSGTTESTTHAYAAPGAYTVIASVADASGITVTASTIVAITLPNFGSGLDSDGDGFSNQFELASGADPFSAASTPGGAAAGTTSLPLSITKMVIKLNFAKEGKDSIQLSGALVIPSGFIVNGKQVILDVGGVTKSFILDQSGKSKIGSDTFNVKIKSKTDMVPEQTAPFSAKFSKGNFALDLADESLNGSANVKKVKKLIRVIVLFNGTTYSKDQEQIYSARQGKTGNTVSPR